MDREGGTQVSGANRDGHRLHAVPIDDGRHLALVTEPPRRARPGRPPKFSDQLYFCHTLVLRSSWYPARSLSGKGDASC